MDQGDFQMPVDFEIDWSLLEDDWSIGYPKMAVFKPLEWMQAEQNAVSHPSPAWSQLPHETEVVLGASQDLPPVCQNPNARLFSGDHYTSFETSVPGLQGTEDSWMNANSSFLLAPDLCSLPHSATQRTILSDCLDPSSFDICNQQQATFPSSPENLTRLEVSETSAACRESGDSITAVISSAQCETESSNSKKRKSSEERRSATKKRLKCPHPGCHLTFPRNYELKRHQYTIHYSNVSILCSVYGCNRVSKPFPRLDKFYEHIRKHHKGPERFICVVESCRKAPLTRAELVEHLKVQHCLQTAKKVEPHLDDSLQSVGLRLTFPANMSPILGDWLACPLWVHGCRFRMDDVTMRGSMRKYMGPFSEHLQEHEHLERSKGYEIILAVGVNHFLPFGLATCPICKTSFDRYGSSRDLIIHLDEHSLEERIMFAPDIAQLFRPYLMGQEKSPYMARKVLEWYQDQDPKFRARVEEAGVLNATTQTSEDHGLQPGNSMGAQGMDFQA